MHRYDKNFKISTNHNVLLLVQKLAEGRNCCRTNCLADWYMKLQLCAKKKKIHEKLHRNFEKIIKAYVFLLSSLYFYVNSKVGKHQTGYIMNKMHLCALCKYLIPVSKLQNVIYLTPPTISEILCVKNVRAIVVCGFLIKYFLKKLTIWKISWELFGSCLLNSTDNPA